MAAERPDGELTPFPWFCFCARLIARQIVFFYPGQPSAGLRNVSTDQKKYRDRGISVTTSCCPVSRTAIPNEKATWTVSSVKGYAALGKLKAMTSTFSL